MKEKSLKLKNPKFWKTGKKWSEDKVNIATFPQNLALIRLMVSEKMHFMDDGCRRHGIKSTDTVKQS